MSNPFFDHPIINSPYDYPHRHWELDEFGVPAQKTIENRRKASFVTPIPRPRKQRGSQQQGLALDDGSGLSTARQQYEQTATVISELRDSCKSLKTTLKAEIDEDAWSTLNQRPPLRQTRLRPHRGQGDQSPRRRSDEGL